MAYILFRYLHFFAIVVFAGSLLIQNMAIKRNINPEDARNLAKIDVIYGLSAVFVLLGGLSLWLWVGKPAEFYTENVLFQIKLGLFILIGLIAIYPTVFLNRNRHNKAASIAVPGAVIWMMRIELMILILIPLFAVLMARGVGLNG